MPNMEVCIGGITDNSPPKYASCFCYGHWPADYRVNLSGSMHTHGTNLSRQRWWREADRHQVGGMNSTDSRQWSSPLCLYSAWFVVQPADYLVFWTDRCTVMEETLGDRGDGEELISNKVEGVHTMDEVLVAALEIWPPSKCRLTKLDHEIKCRRVEI